ncbi:MAG: trypsin-like peptidase domain-containing protein [Acidobacteria bacterium]|nr:trypsin-like peptidase domain-containing protein [Acidobacteriota bacterium]MBI3662616.1 trypsin-like peptidase domain-containing protein [Acidobacteriota bacterium]
MLDSRIMAALKPYSPPSGKIPTKRRSFEEVVRDLRHAVYSIVRHRDIGNGRVEAGPLGSGFFVSPEVFLTCNHVIASPQAPHKDGDSYHLVCNLTGTSGAIHAIGNAVVGQNVHLFPDCDLALLISKARKDQPYVSIDFGDVPIGREIGVAGYPLSKLQVVNGNLSYEGLIFRVAKGVVTSTYNTNINPGIGPGIQAVSVIEVNFLFVPGNSGGPVFDAETGRVAAFVHGYTTEKIRERIEEATLIQDLPAGVSRQYIENLNALYSIAIKLERVRPQLEAFGVRL